MATIEDDYKRPLTEIYKELPHDTQKWVDENTDKVLIYFRFWCFFILFSSITIGFFIAFDFINEPIGKLIQRVGSIIPFLAVLGEALFIVKINKLASVIHPAQLTCEIYMQRKFKVLVNISVVLTFLFVGIGSILSGYGDLLFSL
ncbi:hypothetical protein OOT00_10330 [Desulfobotulus sp. H1]|uniref:Uncharacterized protein n=1 Tax=Desulfobotulus pelophilus TaxID=2823377 RepID=A0ABT3NB28_9BACT|nr:hypothetical protein [Desulfobotulus pelophilus]MCW7754381.1 hypothetical protein [Desulfobotulus pelophilus]